MDGLHPVHVQNIYVRFVINMILEIVKMRVWLYYISLEVYMSVATDNSNSLSGFSCLLNNDSLYERLPDPNKHSAPSEEIQSKQKCNSLLRKKKLSNKL